MKLLLILATLLIVGSAQTPHGYAQPGGSGSFRPGVALVIGIFFIMMTVIFLLLIYAKFCHSTAFESFNHDPDFPPGGIFVLPQNHRGGASSGIDKSVIESLPFFRFSALKGSRDGLECAVCLSKFDDADLLRLLPPCKHAFHVDCVDHWLESHSTCPLCRHRIDPYDVSLFACSNSTRFLFNNDPNSSSSDQDSSNLNARDHELELEIFVEREPSSRSFRFGAKNKLKSREDRTMHKFKHRIMVSDVVFRRRWSDVNSSDLMSLSSDMLNVISSKRFTAVAASEQRSPEMNERRSLETNASEIGGSVAAAADVESGTYSPSRLLISPGQHRSMSEITDVPRFHGAKSATSSAAADEKVRRLWLPIARRTVQLFAGRDRGDQMA